MAEKNQKNRWRCTITGCNPRLFSEQASENHATEMSHRTAKWPIRSAADKAEANKRNKTGYYDKYNVGNKSWENRGHLFDPNFDEIMEEDKRQYDDSFGDHDDHIFSSEALGQD